MNSLTEETSIQELPLSVPLIEGPHPPNLDHTPQGQHYPIPKSSHVKMKHFFDTLYQQNYSPSPLMTTPTANEESHDLMMGVSLSMVAMVIGTVLFSSAIASIVAILVTKSTSSNSNMVRDIISSVLYIVCVGCQ